MKSMNFYLPKEMNRLIEMMKEISFFSGSNADFLKQFNGCAGTELKANALKRMMNQYRSELEKYGVSFDTNP